MSDEANGTSVCWCFAAERHEDANRELAADSVRGYVASAQLSARSIRADDHASVDRRPASCRG